MGCDIALLLQNEFYEDTLNFNGVREKIKFFLPALLIEPEQLIQCSVLIF